MTFIISIIECNYTLLIRFLRAEDFKVKPGVRPIISHYFIQNQANAVTWIQYFISEAAAVVLGPVSKLLKVSTSKVMSLS